MRTFTLVLMLTTAGLLFTVAAPAQYISVKDFQKISDTQGGFDGVLDNWDGFGGRLANIGDLDGDGVIDLATFTGDDDGGENRGAVWILFMNVDGTVKAEQKISDLEGGFTGVLDDHDNFGGTAIAGLGDLDGDGVRDIAVGAPEDDDGGPARGAVWILFLRRDGTVKSHQKISHTEGNLGVELEDFDVFSTVANLGDLNGDGIVDLAVTSWRKNKIWILYMRRDGRVKRVRFISETEGGFTGDLGNDAGFGHDITNLGDVDGDGVPDIATGAISDDSAGPDHGGLWIIFMHSNGLVKGQQQINELVGGFNETLEDGQEFGTSVAGVGDLDGDGVPDMLVGARARGATILPKNTGTAWIIFLNNDGTVKASQRIDENNGGFNGFLYSGGEFGSAVTSLGDLDGNGISDIAIGAVNDHDGGTGRGAIFILYMTNISVTSITLIDADTDQPVPGYDPLVDEMQLDLNTLPTHLNFRANTVGPVESVAFSLVPNGYDHIENVPPYALFGDINGDYSTGVLYSGEHTLAAYPYSEDNGDGDVGAERIIRLEIQNGPMMGVAPGRDEYEIEVAGETDVATYSLHSPHPNPFNPSTRIRFITPEPASIRLTVYDLLGRNVSTLVDGTLEAGEHEVIFDAGTLPSGTYLYLLETPVGRFSKMMMLLK